MKIFDKNKNLLAMIIKDEDVEYEKYFATDSDQDLQVAKFNLKKDTKIDRHIHLEQKRTIYSTSEVIVITRGQIEVEIFDKNLELVDNLIAKKGDIVALFQGGHGLKMSTDCEFIEVKQGPYLEEIDKKRF
tara:strand:+ start:55 stop:447 length:393 start_codon:yes stop_codon:yes gene_type:complete